MRSLSPVLAGVVVVAWGAALAGMPDGNQQTSAGKNPCDEVKGATPGLYDLCVEFCGAHDCEPDFTAEDPLADCRPADRSTLKNYREKTQPGDPAMPCIVDPCPCWSADELDLLWPPGDAGANACHRDSNMGAVAVNWDSFEVGRCRRGPLPRIR
jgi:hypothetical protein